MSSPDGEGRARGKKRAPATNGHTPGAVPVSVVRAPGGEIVLHFADGSEPVTLALPDA